MEVLFEWGMQGITLCNWPKKVENAKSERKQDAKGNPKQGCDTCNREDKVVSH